MYTQKKKNILSKYHVPYLTHASLVLSLGLSSEIGA